MIDVQTIHSGNIQHTRQSRPSYQQRQLLLHELVLSSLMNMTLMRRRLLDIWLNMDMIQLHLLSLMNHFEDMTNRHTNGIGDSK
jgi:hypothetical protein